jgi:hypothetical protein
MIIFFNKLLFFEIITIFLFSCIIFYSCRYYKKSDIPEKFSNFIDIFGENEVFLTSHSDFAFVDSILGKCQILEYEIYDKLP